MEQTILCLDMESVLTPEIWVNVAKKTGLKELELTTKDIADYNELMNYRLKILDRENIDLKYIENVISYMNPLE
jgi:phosphoserine/homoserine phosphotransferase